MAITSKFFRSEGQDDVAPANNGGYPVTIEAPSSGTFPTITSARDLSAEDIYRLIHLVYTVDTGKEALLGRRLHFDIPDLTKGTHYFTFFLVADNYETEADISSPDHYGTGWLYQDATAGATTISVRYKNRAMIDGVHACLRADGVSVTDKIHIDSRAIGNTTDTSPTEEVVATDIGTPVDLGDGTWSVNITLQSPGLVNSYTAGGATPVKVQSYPDKVDYAPSFDDKDLTSAGSTTLDLALVEGNNQYTWEDLITIDMLSATTYEVSSLRYGDYAGIGNIASDFSCTNTSDSYFAEESFTIKAGAIAGSPTAGDQITFRSHYQGSGIWQVLHKPADSGIASSQLKVSVAVEEGAV
jgi:hypothetical protein